MRCVRVCSTACRVVPEKTGGTFAVETQDGHSQVGSGSLAGEDELIVGVLKSLEIS